MAGVSSSDFNNYKTQLAEFQTRMQKTVDEQETETNKLKDAQAKEVDHREKEHTKVLKNVEKKAQDALERVKANAVSDISHERKRSEAEVAELKRKLYNRSGATETSEANTLRDQIKTQQEVAERQERDYKKLLDQQDDAYKTQLENQNRVHNDDLEEKADQARDSSNAAYSKLIQEDKNDYFGAKQNLENKYKQMADAYAQDSNVQSQRTQRILEEMKQNYDNLSKNAESAHSRTTGAMSQRFKEKLDANATSAALQNAEQTNELRKQLQAMAASKQNLAQERGQGRAEAIRELSENEASQLQSVWNTQSALLQQEKAKNAQRQEAMAAGSAEALEEKGKQFAKTLAEREADATFERHRFEKTLEMGLKQKDEQLDSQAESYEKRLETQSANAQERTEKALTEQNKAFQQSYNDIRTNKDAEIKYLQENLQEVKTSDDISSVSPAVENSVRRMLEKDYKEKFDTERNRNRSSEQSIQENYSGRVQDVVADSNIKMQKTMNELTSQRDLDRSKFVAYSNETEYGVRKKLDEQMASHEREMRNNQKAGNKVINTQKQRYESIIDDIKTQSQQSLMTLRNDKDFEDRLNARIHNNQMGELARKYERMMGDQREEYELQLENLRTENEKKMRDADMASRHEMEMQKKGYDQRLAQLELQTQERERSLRENYEGQLDQVRKTNERLLRKKG